MVAPPTALVNAVRTSILLACVQPYPLFVPSGRFPVACQQEFGANASAAERFRDLQILQVCIDAFDKGHSPALRLPPGVTPIRSSHHGPIGDGAVDSGDHHDRVPISNRPLQQFNRALSVAQECFQI